MVRVRVGAAQGHARGSAPRSEEKGGAAVNESERLDKRIENTLLYVSLFSYAYFYQASDQSTAARFDLIRSVLERRTLWIDGFCGYNTADIISIGGHYYSVKAPGTSLTGLLPWSIVSWFFSVPLAARNEPLMWALVTYFTILISISLPVALLVVVIYRFGKALGATPGRSAGIALIMAFATILFPYATEMTGEPVAAVCLTTSFYLVFSAATQPDRLRAAFAGFLAGWAVLGDFPSFLVAAAIGLYALRKLPKWEQVFSFALGAGMVAGILMLYNWGAFGGPFFMSYQGYKLPENQQFPEQAVGFVGLTYPRLKILWNVLIDPQRGLFFCNPVLLLIIPGLVYFWRSGKHAEFFVVLEAILAFVLFNASFGESIVSWGGGTATGPRQVTPAMPFFALALVFLPPIYNYVMAALAGLSTLYMLAAVSTNPHFPYEYDNPVWQFALPHYFRGDFSFNRDTYFGGGNVFGDSVAFNLGKLMGLPGPLQLVPLWLGWTIFATELFEDLQIWRDNMQASLGSIALSLAIAILFVPPLTGPLQQRLSTQARQGLLARYYIGNAPGETPPHLIRVDANIDFNNVAELGAMPFASSVVWSGALIAPRTGLYRFSIRADDTGWITIDGKIVVADAGNVSREQGDGTIELSAGTHRIIVGERNIAGDSSAHLLWQIPGGAPEIVPSAALIPDRFDPRRG
jgi:hypothetical protein